MVCIRTALETCQVQELHGGILSQQVVLTPPELFQVNRKLPVSHGGSSFSFTFELDLSTLQSEALPAATS